MAGELVGAARGWMEPRAVVWFFIFSWRVFSNTSYWRFGGFELHLRGEESLNAAFFSQVVWVVCIIFYDWNENAIFLFSTRMGVNERGKFFWSILENKMRSYSEL